MRSKAWVGFVGLGLVLIVTAWVAGYWPEHRRGEALAAQSNALEARLAESEGQVRAARLLGRLLQLSDAVAATNFGEAQTASSMFFDDLRDEVGRAPSPKMRSTLEKLLRGRDAVTASLARADPGVMETLRMMQVTLRAALGYPLPVLTTPGIATTSPGALMRPAAPEEGSASRG